MRPRCLLLVLMASCSSSNDGAVLSFTATDGPGEAARIEIILATPSADQATEIKQRVKPGDTGEEGVVYFRQRATVDALTSIKKVDGFEVRIAPDVDVVPDVQLIPFALIYDADDVLIGVGTVNDEAGEPTTVVIKPGFLGTYQLTVMKIDPDDDEKGVADGEGHAITCQTNAGSWRSGAVWKREGKPQLRLLLPDLDADPEATDALLRENDLDCDQHEAAERDCDDLRPRFHMGQTETCDGEDTDCDGHRLELVEGCLSTNTPMCSTRGVSLCLEPPGETEMDGQCIPTAACGCAAGTGGVVPAGCHSCAMLWASQPAAATPCGPGVGKIILPTSCPSPGGCTIDVVQVEGPWEMRIGPTETGPFTGTHLSGVLTNFVYLRAKYLGTGPLQPQAPSVGAAYLTIGIGSTSRPLVLPVNLGLLDDTAQAQCPAISQTMMQCTP